MIVLPQQIRLYPFCIFDKALLNRVVLNQEKTRRHTLEQANCNVVFKRITECLRFSLKTVTTSKMEGSQDKDTD